MSPTQLTTHWHSLDREQVRELQGRKLHCYLRDCVLPFSKHYQRVFAEAGLTTDDIRSVDDLAKIPFTAKEELLPTPDNPRKSLEFVLVPDPAVLRKRPSTVLNALLRGPARVKEELVVRKGAEERVQTVQDTVRRTEVEVEDDRLARVLGELGRAVEAKARAARGAQADRGEERGGPAFS